MQTQPQQEVERRPWRVWWIVGLTVLALAVVGVGIWAIVAANQTDDIDVATDLVDDWIAGWNADDPEAIVAVFTEDGALIDSTGVSASGTDELPAYAEYWGIRVTDSERTGELTSTGDGTFSYPGRLVVGDVTHDTVIEIELDGDLASRIQVLESTAVE